MPEQGQPAIPPVLGRYRLMKRTGESLLGPLFEAQDRSSGARVFLQLLREDAASDGWVRRRLEVEARKALRLRAPSIARLLDAGEANGWQYVVTEAVQGERLGDLLARGPIDPATANRIAAEIQAAMAEAEANGLAGETFDPAAIVVDRLGRVRVPAIDLAGLGDYVTAAQPTPEGEAATVANTSRRAIYDLQLTAAAGAAGAVAPPAVQELFGRWVAPHPDEERPTIAEVAAALRQRPAPALDTPPAPPAPIPAEDAPALEDTPAAANGEAPTSAGPLWSWEPQTGSGRWPAMSWATSRVAPAGAAAPPPEPDDISAPGWEPDLSTDRWHRPVIHTPERPASEVVIGEPTRVRRVTRTPAATPSQRAAAPREARAPQRPTIPREARREAGRRARRLGAAAVLAILTILFFILMAVLGVWAVLRQVDVASALDRGEPVAAETIASRDDDASAALGGQIIAILASAGALAWFGWSAAGVASALGTAPAVFRHMAAWGWFVPLANAIIPFIPLFGAWDTPADENEPQGRSWWPWLWAAATAAGSILWFSGFIAADQSDPTRNELLYTAFAQGGSGLLAIVGLIAVIRLAGRLKAAIRA